MTSAHRRILNTISYFTKQIFLDYDPALYLSQMDCYQVEINSIGLRFMNGFSFDKSMIFDALNGTLVALCCANLDLNKTKNNNENETANEIEYDCNSNYQMFDQPKKRRRLNNGNHKQYQSMLALTESESESKSQSKLELNTSDVVEVNIVESKNCLDDSIGNIEDCVDCVGLGIIRGVDIKEKILYLLTPVDPQLLNKVDLFVRGSAVLPPVLLNDSCLLNPAMYLNGVPPNSYKVPTDRVLTAMS